MTEHRHGAITFEACSRCHGLWFLPGQLAAPELASGFVPPHEHAAPAAAGGIPSDVLQRECGWCRLPLSSRRIGEVELDICPRCGGVWLDAGEFEHAAAFYRRERTGHEPPASLRHTAASTSGPDFAMDAVALMLDSALNTGSYHVADSVLDGVAGFIGSAFTGLLDNLA